MKIRRPFAHVRFPPCAFIVTVVGELVLWGVIILSYVGSILFLFLLATVSMFRLYCDRVRPYVNMGLTFSQDTLQKANSTLLKAASYHAVVSDTYSTAMDKGSEAAAIASRGASMAQEAARAGAGAAGAAARLLSEVVGSGSNGMNTAVPSAADGGGGPFTGLHVRHPDHPCRLSL